MTNKRNWHKEWSREGSFLVHSSRLRLEVIEDDGFTDIVTEDASLVVCRAKETARGMAAHDFDERVLRLVKEGARWHQMNP